jgi:hypothetical protein
MAELGWRSRLAIALAVLALGLLVRHYVAGMDERFFHASPEGTEGLLRYTLGDYAGAARAYRAYYANGYEPLPGLRPAPTSAKRSGAKPPDVQALLTEGEAAFTATISTRPERSTRGSSPWRQTSTMRSC